MSHRFVRNVGAKLGFRLAPCEIGDSTMVMSMCTVDTVRVLGSHRERDVTRLRMYHVLQARVST